MMTIKEIKRLKQKTMTSKSRAFAKDDDFNYRLNCKVEKILNEILGKDVDGRIKIKRGSEKAKLGLKKLEKFRP